MSDSNWIKLNRSIWDNFVWDFNEPKYCMAWIDMLLMANYKEKKILFDGKIVVIGRGTFVTSMAKLADRWCMNRRTVKRFLDILQSDGMISYTCTARCTTITIEKYGLYQGIGESECTTEYTTEYTAECTPECTTIYTPECTQHKNIKESKEGKKVKNNNRFTPPTVQEVKEYCIERMNNVDAERFVDFYESKGWMVGRNKMKDWKATVRTWEKNSKPKQTEQRKRCDVK